MYVCINLLSSARGMKTYLARFMNYPSQAKQGGSLEILYRDGE